MAKSKFKVTTGLNFLITTGEPFFVTAIDEGQATGVRPITGETGTRHELEAFPVDQLETRHEQIKRNMEYAEYAEQLRSEMEDKLMQMVQAKEKALFSQANHPSMQKLTSINRTDA